jgi:dipeptidyl aminopeptidase/acylaminoacyl peptidase
MTLRSEQFDENPTLVDWNAKGIWFGAAQKTEEGLFLLDPGSNSHSRVRVPGGLSARGVTLSADGKTMAFTGSAANQFAEVYASPVADPAPKRLSDFSSQWKGFRLATREVTSWKSKDGTMIEGVLIKPADFAAGKKYPLLVVIHGGPTGVDTPAMASDRYYPVEEFAAKGAVILKPNYRGSAGYGEKFRSLNVRNLGLGDYDDVISGVDALIARGIADPDRVVAMGWSEGGYISAFITTYSTRFKAVSVGAGISDWMTYYVNTDIHPFTRQYLKATPWDDPEIYKKTSPITYVNRAKTPTLIQQGDQDKRVPPPDSYELYQALKDRGIPVRLIFYKGFGHPINKPKQQRAVIEHNYEFFSKYIWGEEPAAQ